MNVGQMLRSAPQAGYGAPGLLYAQNIPNWVRERAKDFFVYSVDFLPLAASGTATGDIAIQNDSDFLIIAGVVRADDNAAPPVDVPIPQVTIEVTDGGSGRQLQNRAQHITNMFGTGQLPAFWPYPKLLDRATTLQTRVANLTAAAINLRIGYWGFKVFDFPADVDSRT